MSRRERLTALLAHTLLLWYRLRLALPVPGRSRLLLHRLVAWQDTGTSARTAEARGLGDLFRRTVARAPVAAPCLPRSLALARLLRIHGLESGLRVGLRQTRDQLVGHAWVEHHGVAVGDDEAFVRTFRPLCVAGQPRLGETQ